MRPHARYLRDLLTHKWYVIRAGRRLGLVWWQALAHDLSKFGRAEWGPYVDRFEKGAGKTNAWRAAWAHHIAHNAHHWQHWLRDGEPVPMPERYVREMVADWIGMSFTHRHTFAGARGDAHGYYAERRERILLHPETRALAERLLDAPS